MLGALSLSLISGSASGEQGDTFLPSQARVGIVDFAYLEVSDQVSDNCWTNSDTIRAKSRLSFEREGIPVLGYDPAFFGTRVVFAKVTAFGFRTSGVCAVSARFSVSAPVDNRWVSSETGEGYYLDYWATVFERNSIFSNGTNVNQQLAEFYEAAVSDFVSDWISANRTEEVRRFRQNFPKQDGMPMSQEELDAWIASLAGQE
ncbi:hypothetical protein CVM39_07940 [Pseudooceanicola antarcticus]|nr:hypothetical protein CVM39_07940 [Pseudooceanicola antarcticus]